jgi:hypothetical protein
MSKKEDKKEFVIQLASGTPACQSNSWECIRELARVVGEGCSILKKQSDGTYRPVQGTRVWGS